MINRYDFFPDVEFDLRPAHLLLFKIARKQDIDDILNDLLHGSAAGQVGTFNVIDAAIGCVAVQDLRNDL